MSKTGLQIILVPSGMKMEIHIPFSMTLISDYVETLEFI